MVIRSISTVLSFLILLAASSAHGQDTSPSVAGGDPMQLSVPLLEGTPAPFDGLLLTEAGASSCIEAAASARRWQLTAEADASLMAQSSQLYETFITEQTARIQQLSQHSWWDDNGTAFMLGLGFLLGIVLTTVVVAVAHN